MYTLEDITTFDLIYLKQISEEARKLFKEKNITNFQELENYYYSGNPDFKDLIELLLKKAHITLDKLNFGKQVVTYKWPQLEYSSLISKTDKEVNASLLPYNITSYGGALKQLALKEFTIYEVKYLAGKITIDGKNALLKTLYGIGPKYLPGFIDKINFYNEQLERIIECIPDIASFNGNLFTYKRAEKIAIIENNYRQIMIQLFSLSDSFIFGKVDDDLIKRIIKYYELFRSNPDCFRKKSYYYYSIALPLLQIIANYTILEELESESLALTLTRFIKK